eukprot:350394-Chlamydomonas_euryale.AAC.1
MKHPWTTLGGRFPLKGWRDLKPGESNEQHDGLPGGVTFAEANPKVWGCGVWGRLGRPRPPVVGGLCRPLLSPSTAVHHLHSCSSPPCCPSPPLACHAL